MNIPILHNGETIGVLESCREGPYMLFEARCALLPGLRRLYVFGAGGRSALLGVLQPEGGELRLRRRFSRAAMCAWPRELSYAALSEKPESRAADAAKENPPPETVERAGDGSLCLTIDGTRYFALPCALRRAAPGARVRELGGRRYLLFRC